jgi:uncharacterized cupin superfamily protein
MDTTSFENALQRDGFKTETKSQPANVSVPPHAHDFDVRAMVIEGEITLGVAGTSSLYRKGEVFTMAAGCEHTELYGPAGVTYLVGRRQTAA